MTDTTTMYVVYNDGGEIEGIGLTELDAWANASDNGEETTISWVKSFRDDGWYCVVGEFTQTSVLP